MRKQAAEMHYAKIETKQSACRRQNAVDVGARLQMSSRDVRPERMLDSLSGFFFLAARFCASVDWHCPALCNNVGSSKPMNVNRDNSLPPVNQSHTRTNNCGARVHSERGCGPSGPAQRKNDYQLRIKASIN